MHLAKTDRQREMIKGSNDLGLIHVMCMPPSQCDTRVATPPLYEYFMARNIIMFKHMCFHTSGAQLKKRKFVSMLEKKMSVLSLLIYLLTVFFSGQWKMQFPCTGTLTIKCLPLYYTNSIAMHQPHFSLQNLSISFHIMLMPLSYVA